MGLFRPTVITYPLHLLIKVGCFVSQPVDHDGWSVAEG